MNLKMIKTTYCLLICTLLSLSCKQGKTVENIAENFDELINKSVLIEPKIQQKIDTLDWDEIPISYSELGQFPYFNSPKGFEFDDPKTLDYSKLIYYVKNKVYSIEGKTFTTRFATSRDENLSRSEWNQVLFNKSYDDFIKSKGGVLIFKGNIPNDTLKKIGASEVSNYMVGDVYNQPMMIYAIHQPTNRVLIQLSSSTAGAAIGITSIQGFKQTITLINSETIKKELDKVGHIALYINFETGKSRIKAESYQIVSEMVEMLNAHPDLKITIEGHTDDVGDKTSNQQLSENRGKSVVLALTDEGINASRLKSVGYGESRPIEDNATENGKAKNRRVEIRKQ